MRPYEFTPVNRQLGLRLLEFFFRGRSGSKPTSVGALMLSTVY